MTLRTDAKYPIHRAYVVKLSSDATSAALCGRIENLVTGAQQEFASGRELLDYIASALQLNHDAPVSGPVGADQEGMIS